MKSRGQKKGLRKSFRRRISRKNQHRMTMFGGFESKNECHEKTKNWADDACVKFELWHPKGSLESELSKTIKKYRMFEHGSDWQNCHKSIAIDSKYPGYQDKDVLKCGQWLTKEEFAEQRRAANYQ
jgi:hypothetical protein